MDAPIGLVGTSPADPLGVNDPGERSFALSDFVAIALGDRGQNWQMMLENEELMVLYSQFLSVHSFRHLPC